MGGWPEGKTKGFIKTSLQGGWPECQVWADRWVEGEGKGGVYGPLLMKQKNKCFVIYIARKRIFFYDVIVKKKKALLITTSGVQRGSWS